VQPNRITIQDVHVAASHDVHRRLAVFFTSSNKGSSFMSALNGDKSRYNRERKQKIARRKRTRELLARAAAQDKSAKGSAAMSPRSVQA
jgi:hypothetical protein